MEIDQKFNIGEEVYLKTDPCQNKRIVTGIRIRFGSVIHYLVSYVDDEQAYCDYELSKERDVDYYELCNERHL